MARDDAGADEVLWADGLVTGLLAAHVPLTLLIDIWMAEELHSDEVYLREPADCSWMLAQV